MVRSLAVNSNNDIYVGKDGNLAIAYDIEATLFACAQAAKAQFGEMVLAVNQGIPNFQTVWVGAPNIPQFEAYLRAAILAVSGVVRIINLTTTIANNVLSYRIVILTNFGQAILTSNGTSISGALLGENGIPLALENSEIILLE